MIIKMPSIIFLMLALVSCSGYQFRSSQNPLARYDIKHISVPTFVNQSSLTNVSKYFSQRFLLFFSEFDGLKVSPGDVQSSDAVLLGFISSPRNIQNTTQVTSNLFTQGDELEASIGNRSKFYVPKATKVTLFLRLVLVKRRPSFKGESVVIFDRTFPLGGSFGRVISETTFDDSQGLLNYTKNRYSLYATIEEMSNVAVQRFRDLIINVF